LVIDWKNPSFGTPSNVNGADEVVEVATATDAPRGTGIMNCRELMANRDNRLESAWAMMLLL